MRERIVGEHLPLVRALARRYAYRDESLEDLVQVGVVGLIEAIDRFDPRRGERFATFAVPTVLGHIRHHLRDRTASVRVPRRLGEQSVRVSVCRRQLESRLLRAPTLVELASEVGIPRDDLLQVLQTEQALAPVPLSAVENGRRTTTADSLEASDDRVLVAAGFRVLDERERRILHLRFFADLTQAEIAAAVGLSQVQVSRLIQLALARMRTALGADELGEPDDDGG